MIENVKVKTKIENKDIENLVNFYDKEFDK
jgi:hypothetical protein